MRVLGLLSGIIVTGVLVAGCASNAPVPTPPSEAAAPTSEVAPSSTAEASPPATVTVTASPVPNAIVPGGPCRTSQLAVSHVDRGLSGMMKSDASLQFTNTSSTTCTLHGFPTVTAVGANGVTLSKPATQDGTAGPAVTLPPKGTAVAQLLITNVGAYDPSQCTPADAKGLRIYPPDQSTALFLAQDFQVCATGGPNTLRLQSISQ